MALPPSGVFLAVQGGEPAARSHLAYKRVRETQKSVSIAIVPSGDSQIYIIRGNKRIGNGLTSHLAN